MTDRKHFHLFQFNGTTSVSYVPRLLLLFTRRRIINLIMYETTRRRSDEHEAPVRGQVSLLKIR